jgi:hypothetical protein
MVSSASPRPLTVQRRPHQNQSCVEPLELAELSILQNS